MRPTGDRTSGSYVAAPAGVRPAPPETRLELLVPLLPGVTFPFDVLVGIPLLHALAAAPQA